MFASNKKHTQHAPSTKTECDYLNGWIKKTVTYTKISPEMVNHRDLARECIKKKKYHLSFHGTCCCSGVGGEFSHGVTAD